jgi:molecular chaperone GrpE (heat shock protein)
MENLRKRFDREKIDSIKYGSVNFARDILSPGDNLERALSAINEEEQHPQSIKNLIEGLLMVKKGAINCFREKMVLQKLIHLIKNLIQIFTKQ